MGQMTIIFLSLANTKVIKILCDFFTLPIQHILDKKKR